MKSGNPSNLKAIREGRARVQDQGSQLVALALIEAKPLKDDEMWLDICAGPGGKAALLAALAITARAELTCNEIAAHRSKLVESALKPINPNIYVRTGDGRDLGEDSPETFDRILLDAPCTGLGSLRRKPEARWTKSTEDIPELVQLQKQLLQSAWKGLKPGGVLAYSTCSPHVSETIAVVDWLLKEFPSALLLNAQQVLKNVNPNLEFRTKRNTAQLWTTVHGTDSMFLALIAKPIG
jgi:16S rRNA (cytosine967-C5)-methyltransferase